MNFIFACNFYQYDLKALEISNLKVLLLIFEYIHPATLVVDYYYFDVIDA